MGATRLVARLTVSRWARTWRSWGVVVVALSTAVALLVVVAASSAVTADAALRRGVADLPVADRILTVATFREPGEVMPDDLDAVARRALARLGAEDPVRVMMFRELTDSQGGTFHLAAADELARWVELVEGRMPTRCEPSFCEVVQLAERPPAGEIPSEFGVVVVGTVRRVEPMLLAGTFEPRGSNSVLLADGVGHLDQLDALRLFGRSFGWIANVDLDYLRQIGVDRWVDTALAAANEVTSEPWDLGLTAPDETVATQVSRARASAERFRILVGAAALLVLTVAVVGGAAMRRDHDSFRGALRRRGFSARRMAVLTVAEVGGVIVVALGLGIAIGGAIAAVLAGRSGLAVAATVGRAVVDAAPAFAGVAVTAATLCVATLVARSGARGGRRAWRMVDTALVATALGAVLVVLQTDLTRGGSDALLFAALPVLVLAVTALAMARLWPIVVATLARLVPRRHVAARLGLAGARARPLRPAATAAALAAGFAALLFSTSYRATLDRGAADQAAEAVPFDAAITIGEALDRPLDIVTPDVAAEIDGTLAPVLRVTGSIRVRTQAADAVQLVGIDPSSLRELSRWEATVRASDPAAVADAIAIDPIRPAFPLPHGREIAIDATGPSVELEVTAFLRAEDGRVRNVPLRLEPEGGRDAADGGQRLVGAMPDLAGATSLDLVALVLSLPIDQATHRGHNLGEGDSDRISPTGTITLGELTVDGVAVERAWERLPEAVSTDGGRAARIDYVLASDRARYPTQPLGPGASPADPLPMAVDPITAAAVGGLGGAVTLTVNSAPLHGRVTAVLPQFPTVRSRFAVVDRAGLQRVADASSPGTGQPGELWVAFDEPNLTLDSSDFARVTVTYRDQLERRNASDPIGRSASNLLLVGAGAVLVLALAVLVLLVASERRDEAPAMQAWEAEGASPHVLRRVLWWRALAVTLPALPIGLAAGIALARLTSRLIPVTAAATLPKPPLVPGTGTWLGIALVLAAAALAATLSATVARQSYRETMPPRAIGEVE